jgi:hypothetical protein
MAPFSQLDRVSHLAIFRVLPWILMPASACLVTSSPTFDDPVQTKPFLEVETASPDPREIFRINLGENETVPFSAVVRSEDVDENVRVKMLVDYGECGANGSPFKQAFGGAQVTAATFDETNRRAVYDVITDNLGLEVGCHRLTMMVSHEFDDQFECPVDPQDFTQITWTVLVCDSEDQDCAFDPLTCPPVEASCTNMTACLQ